MATHALPSRSDSTAPPLAVILNIYSGPRRRTAHSQLIELLYDRGIDAKVFPAASGKAVVSAAQRALEQGHTTIIAAGGDGTVGTVAGLVCQHNATLGILPLGTFNHFARDLGIPVDLPDAVDALRSTRRNCVDLASVNGRPFVNTSSIGLYPRMVLEREHYRREGSARWLALASSAIHTLRDFRSVSVRLKAADREWEGMTPFVFVGNNTYALDGHRIGSRSSLNEGLLFVCTTAESSRAQLVKMAAETWLGRIRDNPDFQALTSTELWVDSKRSELYVSLDGEVELMRTPLHYVSHHRALRVIVP